MALTLTSLLMQMGLSWTARTKIDSTLQSWSTELPRAPIKMAPIKMAPIKNARSRMALIKNARSSRV